MRPHASAEAWPETGGHPGGRIHLMAANGVGLHDVGMPAWCATPSDIGAFSIDLLHIEGGFETRPYENRAERITIPMASKNPPLPAHFAPCG